MYSLVYITPQHTLQTTLYTKHTDCLTLLHQTSHHPKTSKKGLIYSQMLRYRRIITDDKEFEQKAKKLRVALIEQATKTKIFSLTLTRPPLSPNHNYSPAIHPPTHHVPYHL